MRRLTILCSLAAFLAVLPARADDGARLPPDQQFCNWAGWVAPHTATFGACGSNYWHTSTVSTSGGQSINCAGSNDGIANGFLQGPIVYRCSPAQNWTVVANLNTYTRPLVVNDMGWSIYFVVQAAT